MYPLIRLAKEFVLYRNASPLGPLDSHVSHHRCWPQDLDLMMEMNNGRILTILDLGRTTIAYRVGLLRVMRQNGWALAMAGASVRYRKRIRPFVKFRSVSKAVGWDHRFIYIDQTIWIEDTCAVQALYRAALTDANGIVDPTRAFEAMGHGHESPALPAWVESWIEADATRPWPPTDDGTSHSKPILASKGRGVFDRAKYRQGQANGGIEETHLGVDGL